MPKCMMRGRKQQQQSDMSEGHETLYSLKTVYGDVKMEMMAFEDGRFIMTLGKGTPYFCAKFVGELENLQAIFKKAPLECK